MASVTVAPGEVESKPHPKALKTKGAFLLDPGTKSGWIVDDVYLDPPKEDEVLVRLAASGLCRSDDHLDSGDIPVAVPMMGGHEGAGVIEAVGPGVDRVKVGDHCALAILPNCGVCRFCRAGTGFLCDTSAGVLEGFAPDGTHRIHARGRGLGAMSYLGTFCDHVVVPASSVVPISKTIPLDIAALVGCGVPTGWGSAVNAAEAKVGETSVVIGVGGVGINAVQGFRNASSTILVAVDPNPFKREKAMEFGATHTSPSMEEAQELIRELTHGVMADKAVMTVSVAQGELIQPAAELIRKGGTLVVTAAAPAEQTHIALDQLSFTMSNKRLQGAMYGSSTSHNDIPRLLGLYERGLLMLDELVTKRYTLDEINQGYDDLHEGRILRGLIEFDS